MRTIIAIPPLPRMSGGIAVLYQLAARLRELHEMGELGREVVLAGTDDAPGLAAQSAAGFSVVGWDDIMGKNGAPFLREGDLFLISEGWPNMMAPALAAKARVLVYAQSWIYINTALPEGAAWNRLPVSFLAVSHPVARFLEDMAHIVPCGVIRPVIDPARFRPSSLPLSPAGEKTVRIGWMSRKNKALAEQIMQITGGMDQGGTPPNRPAGRSKPRVEWVEIRNMTPDEVAETLASCHIFLSTGFPEGCPLPPLEAMASGCLVVGFTGYGGWDYMRQAAPGRYAPRIALRPVPWGGNGLYAPDGDVLEASFLLHAAITMVRDNAPEYAVIREQALLTAAAYSVDTQREDVRLAWDMLARNILETPLMGKKNHSGPAIPPESLNMPLTGADSHAHLDMRHFPENELEALLERAKAAGVASIGNVFLSVDAWEKGRARFAAHPGVFFILGIHPTDAMEYTPAEREGIKRAFFEDSRLRAVGEIGLDFYWKDCPPEVQIAAFIDQLHLARELGKPVVIHSRDAYEETVTILRNEGFHGYPLLWHCFGGTQDQAQYLVDAGWHLSVPGPVTYPANTALREALAVIPPDRLLAETDCPYLTPMPYRGKRNEPAYTVFTVAAMAEALGVPAPELWTRCGDNARRFFGLDPT